MQELPRHGTLLCFGSLPAAANSKNEDMNKMRLPILKINLQNAV